MIIRQSRLPVERKIERPAEAQENEAAAVYSPTTYRHLGGKVSPEPGKMY
jgi:hypothetical protein